MTASKQELIGKFAQHAGADVPGVSKTAVQIPTPQADEIHINTQPATAPEQAVETATDPEPELFTDSYSDRTQVKPWESSKYRSVVVALCVIPVFAGIGWFFRNGVPKPQLNTKHPTSPTVASDTDSDKPKSATDGEWSSLAATNGMHQQFSSAAQPPTPTTPNNFKNTKGVGKTGAVVAQPTPRVAMTPSRIAMTRARTVPMDYDSQPLTRSYTPRVSYQVPQSAYPSYRPPTPVYASHSVLASRPTVPAVQQATSATADQKSAQERWMALATGTSAQAGNETGSEQTNSNQPAQPVAGSVPLMRQSSRSPYSAQNAAYLPSESSVIDGQPQSLIHRSAKAEGRLVSGIAFTPGSIGALNGQPVEIEITDTLDSQIPRGARIVAVVDASGGGGTFYGLRSAAIHLVPTALAIGDMEVPLDGSAIAITGNNGKPLIAKAPRPSVLQTIGGILGPAVQGVGLANLGAGQNASFGNGTYLTAIGANIGTTLLGNATQRLQQSSSQQSVLILPEQTEIQINVIKPLSLPMLGGLQGAAVPASDPSQSNLAASGFKDPSDTELYSLVQQDLQDQQDQQPQSIQEGQANAQ